MITRNEIASIIMNRDIGPSEMVERIHNLIYSPLHRKIISASRTNEGITAVCDDGTMWHFGVTSNWSQYPNISFE